MEWTVRPLSLFQELGYASATCSGGNTLDHCNQKGALLACGCDGGLVIQSLSS